MFSDDEDYENIRDSLFDPDQLKIKEANENELTLFGMYSVKKEKKKMDVFNHDLDFPTNSKDPYESNIYSEKYKKPVQIKKIGLASNYSFFGMNQLHEKVEKPSSTTDQCLSTRERLFKIIDNKENIRMNRKRKSDEGDFNKNANEKKRERKLSSSSSSSHDSDSDTEIVITPRRSTRTVRKINYNMNNESDGVKDDSL